ncbi:hypothetical protein [Gottfriedia solisilvae]|uniref:hypothetical protein n=1 Tax=Gottfriedia solisilvae TaxID=1516104 RepID=UPI003D2EE227
MGVGIQLTLYLVISTLLSFLFLKLGITSNIYLTFFIMIIATIFTVRLSEKIYKNKFIKKTEV